MAEKGPPGLPAYARLSNDGVTLSIKVKPRSSRRGPCGEEAGCLVWGVGSAPVDGEANRELIESIAKHYGVRKSSVSLVRGETSRLKVVLLAGVTSLL